MSRTNIILDFMDPENRILYGSYTNLRPDEHVRLLKEGLNLAAFICEDFCILPPCAIMQCRIARQALMESQYYFDEGIIKFPLRESSLDIFFEKKRKNYALDKTDGDYSEFFAEGGPAFLREHATEIIKRETKIGEAIAAMVEAMPFNHSLWHNLYNKYPISVLEQIQSAPRELIENDEAISVKAIKRLRKLEEYQDIDFQIGRILQNKYFYAYIYEYKANLISDIPPKTTDFLIEHFGPAYEYSYWRFLLKALGLLNLILKSGSRTIVQLRDIPGCYDFVNSAIALGDSVSSVKAAKQLLSAVTGNMRQKLSKTVFKALPPVPDNQELSLDSIEQLASLFWVFMESFREVSENKQPTKQSWSSETISRSAGEKKIEELKQQLIPCDLKKPFIFIGYTHKDMEETVYKDCILLGKMGVNYWVDNANMHGCNQNSEGWKTVVKEALSACGIYIPYVSPLFFDSRPCCEEVKNFFDLNKDAGILILLKNGFTADEIITKILTYDNILQGEDANNMMKLFKASAHPSTHQTPYIIDQLYRHCAHTHFEHYICDSLFYNTFLHHGIINRERFPNYQSWHNAGCVAMEEVSL